MSERILVRAPNWIGDAVVSLGFLSMLKETRPGQVSVLAHARVAELFRNHPAVDELLVLQKDGSILDTVAAIRQKDFHSCYLLPLSFSSAAIVFLAGIPQRIGYSAEFRGWMLTRRLRYRKRDYRSRHLLLGYARLLGEGTELKDPQIRLSPQESDWADGWLRERGIGGRIVGFCPGATYGPAKIWPRERWETLGRDLAAGDFRILLFGSADEAELCSELEAAIGPAAVSFAGRSSLRQSAALLSRCAYAVCNDTGVMHLSAAVGTRTIGIFGSTNPVWTRPWGEGHTVIYSAEPCSPCYGRRCRFGHYRCLETISAAVVREAIDKEG